MGGTVHILGAGLAGMVAAVNLARAGREVLVIEGARGIGGLGGLHPSVHTTPIDPAWMSGQVGIDLTPVFHPIRDFSLGINEKTFRLVPGPLHAVERGARPGAIDSLLFARAREAGVKFEFGTLLKDLRRLPKGSIVATGLQPEMYDYLQIPFEIPRGFASTARTDRDPWCGGILSSYTDDYFYANCANRLMYGLLFGRGRVTEEGLETCKEDIRARFGLELGNWEYFTVRVPTGSARNPRLYQDGYILAGTLSGSMDPGSLFGIHGAILSGKVAATAVENPRLAEQEFKRLNRYYRVAYFLKEFQRRLPGRLAVLEASVRHPRLLLPLSAVSSLAVPGYRRGLWVMQVMRGARLA